MTHWIRQYGGSLLIVILAFAYITRMYNLHIPEGYMFDEVYHAVTAKLIAQNDPRAYEWWNPPPEIDTAVDWLHPPVAKYFQAASILAFGENSFGWRFSSVVFGVLVIVAIYHLTMALFDNHAHAVGAAALASLDGLLLVQSRIAMNDIFVTFFILMTLLYYVYYKKNNQLKTLLAVGVLAGLAVASKWSGLFVLGTVVFLEFMRVAEQWAKNKWSLPRNNLELLHVCKKFGAYIIAFLLIPIAVYVLSYSQMFLQGKGWTHFKELHNQIWQYQTHLEAEHPYQSRPWQWALNLRPVWYHVEYNLDDTYKTRGDVYAFGNPALLWLGLGCVVYTIVMAVIWLFGSRTMKGKKSAVLAKVLKKINTSPLFLVVTAYWMVWLPWTVSPRIMFFYHYAPAIPLLCIVLGYWLRTLFKNGDNSKVTALLAWGAIGLCFMIWYPHWVGIPIPVEIKDDIYFSVPSWK